VIVIYAAKLNYLQSRVNTAMHELNISVDEMKKRNGLQFIQLFILLKQLCIAAAAGCI